MAEGKEARKLVLSHDPKDEVEAAAAVLGIPKERHARLGKLTDEQIAEAAITGEANAAADRIIAAQAEWDRKYRPNG